MDRESQAATFMRWLMRRYTSGYIEIRMLCPGQGPQLSYHQIPQTDAGWSELAQMCITRSDQGWDVYCGVLPRWERSGRDASVDTAGMLWADIDVIGTTTVDELRTKAEVIVSSGKGYHLYRRLAVSTIGTKKTEQATFVRVLRSWAAGVHQGVDMASTNVSRILRVPGTKNWKDREHPKDVRLMLYPADAVEAQSDDGHPWSNTWVEYLNLARQGMLPVYDSNALLGKTKRGGNYYTYDIGGSVLDVEWMRRTYPSMTEHAYECATLLVRHIRRLNDVR
jgi:hypothetical protein